MKHKEDLEVGGCTPPLNQKLESRFGAGGCEGACMAGTLTDWEGTASFIYLFCYLWHELFICVVKLALFYDVIHKSHIKWELFPLSSKWVLHAWFMNKMNKSLVLLIFLVAKT